VKLRVSADEKMVWENSQEKNTGELCFGDAFVYPAIQIESAQAKFNLVRTFFVRFMLTFWGGLCEC
jgi:hypothetical protein